MQGVAQRRQIGKPKIFSLIDPLRAEGKTSTGSAGDGRSPRQRRRRPAGRHQSICDNPRTPDIRAGEENKGGPLRPVC